MNLIRTLGVLLLLFHHASWESPPPKKELRTKAEQERLDHQLWDAVFSYRGSRTEIEALLLSGASPDIAPNGYNSVLMCAIGKKDEDLALFLLERGASPMFQFPLFRAMWVGLDRIIDALLAHKDMDINKADDKGYTPLLTAYYHDCEHAINQLIKRGADTAAKTSSGNTHKECGLAGAIDRGETAHVQEWLAAGANPNCFYPHYATGRMSALSHTISHSSREIALMLLEHNADAQELQTPESEKPFSFAVKLRAFNLFAPLLKAGATPNIAQYVIDAVRYDSMWKYNLSTLNALLALKPNVDLTVKDSNGLTAWDYSYSKLHLRRTLRRVQIQREVSAIISSALIMVPLSIADIISSYYPEKYPKPTTLEEAIEDGDEKAIQKQIKADPSLKLRRMANGHYPAQYALCISNFISFHQTDAYSTNYSAITTKYLLPDPPPKPSKSRCIKSGKIQLLKNTASK